MNPDPTPPIRTVAAAEAARLVAAGEAVLLDVREDEEWSAGHAPAARHLPLGRLAGDTAPPEQPLITVCRGGGRSAQAAAALTAAGRDVRSLDGGMTAWAAQGLPVVRDDGTAGTVA